MERSAPGISRHRDFIDWMRDDQGKIIKLGTLWSLVFGGGLTSSPQTLYFTTGLVNRSRTVCSAH